MTEIDLDSDFITFTKPLPNELAPIKNPISSTLEYDKIPYL